MHASTARKHSQPLTHSDRKTVVVAQSPNSARRLKMVLAESSKRRNLLGHHHAHELVVGELLAEVGHHVTQLGGRDESVAVLVEDLEGLVELLVGVGVLHLASHQVEELGEIDGSVAVGVD